MEVYKAVQKRRTIRKFKNIPVEEDLLIKIINGARLSPFGANLQPLKFKIITDESLRKELFPHIRYAGYLPDFNPTFEESPPVFIAILNDENIKPTKQAECDAGSAITTMCLIATELNIDSCWLGAINRPFIKEKLQLKDNLQVLYLLGLGYGLQTGEYYDSNETVKYSLDNQGNFLVPKRPLKDILV